VFRDLPAGCWWTYEAECDRHVLDGEYTGDDFQAAWVHVANLAASVGCPAKSTLMLTGYVFEQRFPTVWPGGQYVDVIAVDPYGHVGETAAGKLDAVVEAADANGCGWGIGETGWNPGHTDETANTLGWITDLADYCRRNRPDFVCWWENPACRISDVPEAAAAYRAIPRA